MLIIGLDISTKTGYAVIDTELQEGQDLKELGLLTVHEQEGPYPWSYIRRSEIMVSMIIEQIEKFDIRTVVIEDTNPGRNAYGQKLLEWTHFLVLKYLQNKKIPVVYLRTGIWRQKVVAKLNDEEKKSNQKLNRLKEKANGDPDVLRALKKENGIQGKVSRKAPALRIINELYPYLKLKKKDNDKADAICLCLAYKRGAEHCDPKIEQEKKKAKKREENNANR